jgi:hypothetical protein
MVLTVAALLATAVAARAQITSGSVAGTVKDVQGGVVPGATIVVTNEAQGTKSTPVVSNARGDFVVPNVAAGTYSVEVTMPSFKMLRRTGIAVNPGVRAALGTLTLEIGGASETVEVKAESPTIQATSGERSFTIPTDSVANLPIANRSFTALANLTPGVVGSGNNQNPSRIGGGGGNNIMMDGVSAVDTGSNSILLQMNVESIQEVKVLTSGYQAEFGRSAGLQITAVTKSGTNRFRGSLYDVERNSAWDANSKVNKLNGDPKNISKQRDWGYSIGGPVGKPGSDNKLFFFYSHEYAPRTAGNDRVRLRLPTALERRGDFSQSYDNNGNPYHLIKNPNTSSPCTASNTSGCYADGGVLGRIPASAAYGPGVNVLNWYPLPNIADAAGLTYNYEAIRPAESALAWQPAVRVDYQPRQNLRGTFKYSGWQQRHQTFNGNVPGFNDSRMQNPIVTTTAYTVNYTISPTTFLEATYGHSQNELAGCALAQGGTGPTFCTSAIPMNETANRNTAGLGGLPMIFPSALQLNPSYYAYRVLSKLQPPMFVNGQVLRTPNFTWGGRVGGSQPTIPFAGYLNINSTHDVSISVTKVLGRHTMKTGFYNTHSFKAQQQNSGATFGTISFSNDTSNPLDTSYPFSNAYVGVFQTYNQLSQYIEGSYVYNNTEAYVQDNWKLNGKLTLDYGVRFIHQQPQYDSLGQASNFFPEKWTLSAAPTLYAAGCANGVYPCSGSNRQAMNPTTGAFLGAGSTAAIGTLVPNTGTVTNGLILSGKGIAKTTYTYPGFAAAPRFGFAFDPSGKQRVVFRGGAGLYFDRPSGNDIYAQVTNPPSVQNVTARYGFLQNLAAGLQITGAPALNVYQYDAQLPSSNQWNGGVQIALPWSTSIDVEYVGQHSWNSPQAININAIDLGTAFLPEYQDKTLSSSLPLGSGAVVTDLMRAYRGFGSINRRMSTNRRTYHSLQVSFQRRFVNGLSFGFNDAIGLYDRGNVGARLQHAPDGSFSYRSDQAEANRLLGNNNPQTHIMKANFVWDLPDLSATGATLRTVGWLVNDWQLSGIWTAATGSAYTVGFSYQSGGSSVNLTGSPDYAARVRIVGDPGAGCSSNTYQQFNTAAFQGPLVKSVGLESGNDYLRGCFSSVLDLAIARNIRLPKGRNIQLRVDMFNAPNEARITGRQTTMNLRSPSDPVTITNLPFDGNGTLIAARSLPRGAGFGVANGYQSPRTVQAQIRFSF